jgi:hypothetical protein
LACAFAARASRATFDRGFRIMNIYFHTHGPMLA